MMPKFYAVRHGRVPGIYTSWDVCKKQIIGFSGCSYKSFKSQCDADTFMAGQKKSKGAFKDRGKSTVKQNGNRKSRSVISKDTCTETCTDTLSIYTDGSCPGNQNVESKAQSAGWGFVVLRTTAPHDSVIAELWGPVVCDESSPYYLGARYGSNNTGICL